jgi:nitrate reductase beta subunit
MGSGVVNLSTAPTLTAESAPQLYDFYISYVYKYDNSIAATESQHFQLTVSPAAVIKTD